MTKLRNSLLLNSNSDHIDITSKTEKSRIKTSSFQLRLELIYGGYRDWHIASKPQREDNFSSYLKKLETPD